MHKLAMIAALAAFTTSAFAEEVRIQTTGKDNRMIRAEVLEAAHALCERTARTDPLMNWDQEACVEQTYDATLPQLKHFKRMAQKRMTRIALSH